MSLTATISTSAPDSCAARKTLRPMRPKPLIPTRTGMAGEPFPLAEDRPGRLEGEARLSPDTDVRHGGRSPVKTGHGCPASPSDRRPDDRRSTSHRRPDERRRYLLGPCRSAIDVAVLDLDEV